VRADGWYRITQPQFAAAGFDTTGDARIYNFLSTEMKLHKPSAVIMASYLQRIFVEFWDRVSIHQRPTRKSIG